MVLAVRTAKNDAESVRAELMAAGLLNRSYRIRSDGNDILIPVISEPPGLIAVDAELEPIQRNETDYRNIADVPSELRDSLPSSFDVIGDVAVVKVPDELVRYRGSIGDAIMKVTSSIRLVMMDMGVKGELRIRELEPIAGTGSGETIHREFGVRMATDPSKVYFNPRLATERRRVASLVKEGEIVIDMFAGVAPFPLVISKHAKPHAVYSIDLNPDAKRFMDRNIAMNKVTNIVPIQGDARAVLREIPKADRIIMNLPQSATDFLTDALRSLNDGGVIHLHRIMEKDADHDDILRTASENGFEIEIKEKVELKTYSPTMSVFVFDILKITSSEASE